MPSEVTIEQWYSALGSPCGVIIDCLGSDPEKVRQKLYAIRKTCADPDLSVLSVVISPTNPTRELWIVKRTSDETKG